MENTTGLTVLLSTLSEVLEVIITSMTSFIELIISQPYLLIGVVLMLIGAAVSFLKRLIRV